MTNEQKYIKNLYKGYMIPPDKIPLIVSNTALAGYFFGEEGLAVVSFLMPVFFLFETIGFWINYGAFAKSIEAVSNNETELARSFSSIALIWSVISGVIISIAVISSFDSLIEFLEIPIALRQMANDYGIMMAICGMILVIASYCWQFVKMIGLQAMIRKIYIFIMIVDALIAIACIKIFNLGIVSLAFGMIGALLFVILMSGLWFSKTFKKNLFGEIKNPVKSIIEIIIAGSSASLGKFYSLFIVFFFNILILKTIGVSGVAAFATIQIAVRICRLHSQVTWQPILPILTMEFADRNAPSISLLFKHSLKQAIIMAALPAIVIYFGVSLGYFVDPSDQFAVESFKAYSLSVIFAAINSTFIIWYSVINHKILSNVFEVLRSLVLILVFIALAEPSAMFYSFLFAESIVLILILISWLMIKKPVEESIFFVVDRQAGLTEDDRNKINDQKLIDFISEWIKIVRQFSDTGKNDFMSIHLSNNALTIRSTGKLFDYSENDQAKALIKHFGFTNCKCTYTLGLNNLYLKLS